MKASVLGVLVGSLVLSSAVFAEDDWQCQGFGYAYSYKSKELIYSSIQHYRLPNASYVPSDIEFKNDWKRFLKAHIGSLRTKGFSATVVQNCSNRGKPKGAKDDLYKVMEKYSRKGFAKLQAKNYTYQPED
ncbi:hypothetical protein ACMXYW_03825 [Neptuniibacter sp. QD48_55]|uniref:hypothetical protein n=1 Tax=Neptuniibacter sp. QD48_55 TaxID=3398212 RepID=UPI0039F581F7